MSESPKSGSERALKRPWNKGKLVGAKPPLQPKHVWAVRTRLQLEGRLRNLALFNLAVDSKLRACDLVRPRVAEIAPPRYAAQRANVQMRKTGRTADRRERHECDRTFKSRCSP